MKNIFALFMIFAGMTQVAHAAGIEVVLSCETYSSNGVSLQCGDFPRNGYVSIKGSYDIEIARCEKTGTTYPYKCNILQQNNDGNFEKPKNTTSITGKIYCGDIGNNKCGWKVENIEYSCATGFYYNPTDDILSGHCFSIYGEEICGIAGCAPCPYLKDNSENKMKIWPKSSDNNTTGIGSCFLPNDLQITEYQDGTDKKISDCPSKTKFGETEYCNIVDENGNTFILIDDCHHNDYVAPATPASDE